MIKVTNNLRLRTLLLCLAIYVSGLNSAGAQSASEYDVKTALLYKAAKFIDWPATDTATNANSRLLCVVGSKKALKALEKLDGKGIRGLPIEVKRISTEAELANCAIAFFEAKQTLTAQQLISAAAEYPILTVGQSENFAEQGGIMSLVVSKSRVNILVNGSAVKTSQLNVNSQLMEVATVVQPATTARQP